MNETASAETLAVFYFVLVYIYKKMLVYIRKEANIMEEDLSLAAMFPEQLPKQLKPEPTFEYMEHLNKQLKENKQLAEQAIYQPKKENEK